MTTRRPTRADRAGQAYLELRRKARGDGRATDEYLRLYVLEGFLARLAVSRQRENLVLKGGVLLAAYAIRRPTADVDIAARRLPGELEDVRDLVAAVAAHKLDDGIEFDTASVSAEQIRDEDEYAGIRVSLTARLASAVVRFHVDVNIGDPIYPQPAEVRLPRLLGGEIVLRGYPLEMVLAEKLVTALERATVNTRWRDFADIYLLASGHAVSAEVLYKAVRKVADHRRVSLRPLSDVLDGYGRIGQSRWAAWRRKQALERLLPEQFTDVLALVIRFADPALGSLSGVTGQSWQRDSLAWGPG
ncbi:nucleotidyl transferase AbiEii/AbiGii toxin family protein [Qaidamihabitans albus]|uniref:nucleotidyl transferase AbiEii/AbiGii toxin family protein n=1 Tax=Qaidamihabitans albus TaxID=2795733 RepID=UPI0018F143C4|nr:nucleotidyl transferase AbiEii/AbiGii toxin family protein [Qaidamihabitans albus]